MILKHQGKLLLGTQRQRRQKIQTGFEPLYTTGSQEMPGSSPWRQLQARNRSSNAPAALQVQLGMDGVLGSANPRALIHFRALAKTLKQSTHQAGARPSCACVRAPDPKSCCYLPSHRHTLLWSQYIPRVWSAMSPNPLQSSSWQLSNLHFTPSATQTRKRPEFHSHPEELWTTPPASAQAAAEPQLCRDSCSSHHALPQLSTASSLSSCSDSPSS